MTKGSYIWQGNTFVPKSEAKPVVKNVTHSIITDEMEPLEHPATREMITSKRKFRKITRDHGYEELGDQERTPEEKKDDDAEYREAVQQAIAQLSYGEGITDEERDICRMKDQMEEWERD